jgi:pimeloyl-ACP methyl ester carboxylesterase
VGFFRSLLDAGCSTEPSARRYGSSGDVQGVTPFRISIPEADLEDLRARLDRARWFDEDAPLIGWEGGPDGAYMRRLAEHWRERYDWRAHEAALNTLPHFRAQIDGYQVHFLHVRARRRDAIPLLITHGWPGSFVEFLELVSLLREDGRFDLVVPSIPGFGFSSRPGATATRDVARLWLRLMTRLEYERFALQGGDLGAGISSWIARFAPDRVIGLHLNFLPGSFRPWLGEGSRPLSAGEERLRRYVAEWSERDGAYSHMQRTTPRTPAYALNDSPIGLAAWIVEKFYLWSDRDDDDEAPFTLDDLLTNISLYWFTRSIGSSVAIYRDSAPHPLALAHGERIEPPLAFAAFPREITVPPPEWIARGFNLQRYTTMPRGGHFAALEAPRELAGDIRAFFIPAG